MTTTPEQVAKLKAEFEEWFVKNYPSPSIIRRPEWHTPKIFRAATHDMADLIARMDEVLKAADALEAVMTEYSKYTDWVPQKAHDALAAYRAAREKLHD